MKNPRFSLQDDAFGFSTYTKKRIKWYSFDNKTNLNITKGALNTWELHTYLIFSYDKHDKDIKMFNKRRTDKFKKLSDTFANNLDG